MHSSSHDASFWALVIAATAAAVVGVSLTFSLLNGYNFFCFPFEVDVH